MPCNNQPHATDRLTPVFTRIANGLKATARRLLGSDEEAEDAIQEAFVRLWGRRDKFASSGQIEGTLHTTVRNICIDGLRRQQTHPTDSIEDQNINIAADMPAAPDWQDTYDEVTALIANALSERDRQVLYMRDRDGMEFEDISVRTGLSEANIRVIISRSRRTIRQLYLSRR